MDVKKTLITLVTAPSLLCAAPLLEGYWESWNTQDSIETIVGMHSDVIDISFGTFEKSGEGFVVTGVQASDSDIDKLVNAAHSCGKQVKLSIGGATYPLSSFLKTSEDAKEMALAVYNYITQFDLDGVDYDIEDYPSASLQVELLANSRALLGDKVITYTPKAPASTTLPYSEVIQNGHHYLNSVNIMAYDTYPGYSYKSDAEGLMQMGVPAEKIEIGLMPGLDDVGAMTDLQDCADAADYVVENGLAGVMVWDLNRDHEDLTGLGVDAATDTIWHTLHDERA